ncbi:uncharacterized protein LOC121737422 [Aricia agestis]|uniref:uncharacterized protein LOC121737422 n=1 Tax=Aricia agestis TaxID=91739 RepID=UPI001C20ADB0|nr:uncharacterized protein LOC121737422 [Aricia agestis]
MAGVALLVLLPLAAAGLADLSRRDNGDVFTLYGDKCGPSQCSEHGAGTVGPSSPDRCSCACPQRAPLFREDRELCVDDLPECSLAIFGSGGSVQRIPFVYLPLKGQIIHPSKDIVFPNVKTPICAVSGAQFLTRKGFLDLRNTLDADVPFALFRDEGRTFLQWTGEDDVRSRMSGRVMVVRLLCRDVSAMPTSPLDLRGVFTPCVAFRVQGAPPRHINNITEVQFTPNAQTSVASSSGLSVAEYVAIGISSLLLGLIYVASVFLYLHIKKRRQAVTEANNKRILKNLKGNGGSPITERDIIRITNERAILPNSMGQDDGVIKKNPLLTVGRHLYDRNVSSDLSDCDDNGERSDGQGFQNSTISAIIHQRADEGRNIDNNEYNHREEPNIERLPDEHVSIVETIDEREIARPVGTTRRKLYFNPAYFEPHLMADPPAAALEFLSKIREVIAIAKQKMAAKRFQPILNEIPEEETYPSYENSIDYYHRVDSQRSGSIVSLKRENSRRKSVNCLGCPGCQSNNNNEIQNVAPINHVACNNCRRSKGELQQSIRKWLENIPQEKQPPSCFENINTTNQSTLASSLLSLPLTVNNYKAQDSNSDTYNSLSDFVLPKRPRSANSEPISNYNMPPEFNTNKTNNLSRCHTVSHVNENKNIIHHDCRGGSLRNIHDVNRYKNNRTFMKNKNTLPDMVNEAIELETKTSYNLSSSDDERLCKENNIVNDYETDSLERTSHRKVKGIASDVTELSSSQASPSLSTALPLEEELTIRNDIYKVNCSSNSNTPSPDNNILIEHDHYESIEAIKSKFQKNTNNISSLIKKNADYNLVSEVYVNNNYNFGSAPTSPSGSECSMGSRKFVALNNSEETTGPLTIEVKDPPENYIKIHESDGFEPDTLDRKYSKQKDLLHQNISNQIESYSCEEGKPKQRFQLMSSGTFSIKNMNGDSGNTCKSLDIDQKYSKFFHNAALYSGSKSLENTADDDWEDTFDWTSEEGRILTLELRHSKRQRQCTPPTIKQMKNLPRPDVLPPLPPVELGSIYEKPISPPRRVERGDFGVTKISPGSKPHGEAKDNLNSLTSPYSSLQAYSMPSSQGISGPSSRSEYDENDIINCYDNEIEKEEPGDCDGAKEQVYDMAFSNRINTNTFVKGVKIDTRNRFRRKKGLSIEDSGYLSSDSTSSKQTNPKNFQKKIVVAKVVSCSESEDTENEARSESGAESVETHSVYFDSKYKDKKSDDNFSTRVKSVRDKRKVNT